MPFSSPTSFLSHNLMCNRQTPSKLLAENVLNSCHAWTELIQHWRPTLTSQQYNTTEIHPKQPLSCHSSPRAYTGGSGPVPASR